MSAMNHKLAVDQYIQRHFDIGPFRFAERGICNGCKQLRLLIHHDLFTLQSFCYDCFAKRSCEEAMAHGDMKNQYWKFLVSIGRNKMVEDLLYEYDPSIDIRPPFKPDDEEVVDEED